MIQKNDQLLLHKGQATDYAGRTFTSISAFQYALWALDWHMWKMICKYLPQDAQREQLQNLHEQGTDHSIQFDFQPILTAYKTLYDNWETWSSGERATHFFEVIGVAQANLPVHVVNEFFHPTRSFNPTPTFTEASLPRRTDDGDGWEWLTFEYDEKCIGGGTFGWAAGLFVLTGKNFHRLGYEHVELDNRGLANLYEIRTQQMAELATDLNPGYSNAPHG